MTGAHSARRFDAKATAVLTTVAAQGTMRLHVGPQVSPARLSGRTAPAGRNATRNPRPNKRPRDGSSRVRQGRRRQTSWARMKCSAAPAAAIAWRRPSSRTAAARAAASTSTAASIACRSTRARAGNARSKRSPRVSRRRTSEISAPSFRRGRPSSVKQALPDRRALVRHLMTSSSDGPDSAGIP